MTGYQLYGVALFFALGVGACATWVARRLAPPPPPAAAEPDAATGESDETGVSQWCICPEPGCPVNCGESGSERAL